MSSRHPLTDPLALLVAVVLALGTFLVVPGVLWALLAAIAVGILCYGITVGVRALLSDDARAARPAVGASADAVAEPRVRRGSAVEVWLERGRKALDQMRRLVASSDQPSIRGQLENVVLEAGDSIPVLEELAAQGASLQAGLHGLSPGELRDRREHLQAALADPNATAQIRADRQQALDAVAEQEATLGRLVTVQAGVSARMESIVRGLEQLAVQMKETMADAAAPLGDPQSGDERHLQDLSDQLAGLRAGLEESRRYTAGILGPQEQ